MMRVEMSKVQYLGAERLRRPGRFDWSVQAHEGSCAVYATTVRRDRGKSLASTLRFGKAVIHPRNQGSRHFGGLGAYRHTSPTAGERVGHPIGFPLCDSEWKPSKSPRNPLLRVRYEEELQIPWGKGTQPLDRPRAHGRLDSITISGPGHHHVLFRRDAVGHIARSFTLVI